MSFQFFLPWIQGLGNNFLLVCLLTSLEGNLGFVKKKKKVIGACKAIVSTSTALPSLSDACS